MTTRKQIIATAQKSGFAHAPPEFKHWRGTISDLERFYASAYEAGRVSSTQDLSNCILCDAEPVGFFEVNDFGNWEQDTRNIGTPLYKARKP